MAEQIPHTISSEVTEPTVAAVRLGGCRCYHACTLDGERVAWLQHLEAAKIAAQEMAAELAQDIEQMGQFEAIDTTQPVYIAVTFAKGRPGRERKAGEQVSQLQVRFSENTEEAIRNGLQRLPKLLWRLKRTFDNKRPDLIMFSLEYTIRINSAPFDKVVAILKGSLAAK